MPILPNQPGIPFLDGYPEMTWDRSGLTIDCAWLCPWDLFPGFVNYLQGYKFEFAGSPLSAKWVMETPNDDEQVFDACECTSVKVKPHTGFPFKSSPLVGVAPRYKCHPAGEDAKVRVDAKFETVTRTKDPNNPDEGVENDDGSIGTPHPGGDEQPSMVIKYKASATGEVTVCEGRGFEWKIPLGGGAFENRPVTADISVVGYSTIIDHFIIFQGAPNIPTAVGDKFDKVNSAPFDIPLIGRTVEEDHLRFAAFEPEQEYRVDAEGAVTRSGWTITYKLRERVSLRWDEFYCPDDDVKAFTQIEPKPYQTADLAGIFKFR